MAQYVYTMNRVGKIVPPKRVILKDISLSFFPGAAPAEAAISGAAPAPARAGAYAISCRASAAQCPA